MRINLPNQIVRLRTRLLRHLNQHERGVSVCDSTALERRRALTSDAHAVVTAWRRLTYNAFSPVLNFITKSSAKERNQIPLIALCPSRRAEEPAPVQHFPVEPSSKPLGTPSAEQLKAEEKQLVLGVLMDFFVTYARMRLH